MNIERSHSNLRAAGGWLLCALLVAMLWLPAARAQEMDFRTPAATTDPALPAVMRDLAERLLPVYQDSDTGRYLDNLSALQLVTANWSSAWSQRQSLQERHKGVSLGRDAVIDLYSHARLLERQEGIAFPQSWAHIFRQTVPRLSDPDALELGRLLKSPVYEYRNALQLQLDRHRGQGRISLDEGLQLVRAWLTFDAWRAFAPVAPQLVAEDQRSRYQQDDVTIHAGRGAPLTGHLILPRGAPVRLTTRLEFRPAETLGDEDSDLEPAARGLAYVIVQGEPPKGRAALHRHAVQVAGVVRWIGRQPWSNGHVEQAGIVK